ncbi:BTAD domain-containing putative transcriptional regulator [Kitasatospora sp. NPDC059571]|uniref:AfsR/SARP family transcriptional regulator n=1 Tax=Kitasatospora sp. NPDC059571 TaxID=3346871 RepID=UPI00367CC096
MEIRVLGPLTACENGVSIVPSAAKPRQILALLALNSGRVVTVPALMEELWGAALPRSAATTLQTYILQLRRRLCAALEPSAGSAKDVLVTRHGGYLLDAAPGSIDAQEFDRLTAEGYAAYDMDAPEAAARLLTRALALWTGPALVDVQQGRLLEVEVMRLQESRLAALERRIDADLQLARHHEVLGELAGLTAQYPMHENLHAQFMLALYRCGRPSRALEAYRRLRTALVDELGLEPSARLRRLQQSVLAADPSLDDIRPARLADTRLAV